MDRELYTFLVNLSAQVQVIRAAAIGLSVNHVRSHPAEMRTAVLEQMLKSLSGLRSLPEGEERSEQDFEQHVMSMTPEYAKLFVQNVERVLSKAN